MQVRLQKASALLAIALSVARPRYAPSATDGTNLYIASENTTINGTNCAGSIRKVDPATGNYLWQDCLNDGHVLAAVTAVTGVVFVRRGSRPARRERQ